MTIPRPSKTVALAAGAYLVLTLAYTWPLAANLSHGVAHDAGDPILNAWILWWTTQAVPLSAHWWNAPIFYPATGALAFSEHLLGLAPIAAPLIGLTGNPLFGYNVTLLASYFFSALGAHFLGYTLTRRHDAAFVAGVAYAFAPYKLAQLPHIQVLSAYWAPVCLAALHRYDRDSKTRWVALAAAAWLMQALSNGYYLFFLSLLLVLWLVWFALGRWSLPKLLRLAGFFAIAAVALAPFLLGYRHILVDTYGFSRGLGEIRGFSADVASLLHASDDLLLWGWVHAIKKPESQLFPGPTLVILSLFAIVAAKPFAAIEESSARRRLRAVLAVLFVILMTATLVPIFYGPWRLTIGGVRLVSIARADKPLTLAIFAALGWLSTLPRVVEAIRRRSVLAFYVLAAFAMWAFALGPDPEVFGHRVIYQAPYGWLMRLPGFDGLRVPARFWMMAIACLAVVAALAVDRIRTRSRRMVVAIAAVGLLLDGWPRVFIVLGEPSVRPAPPGVAMRLDLPISDDNDAQALYQQALEPVPSYNGFSGYFAPHYYALRMLLEAGDPRILHVLAGRGPLGIVVHHSGDPDGSIRRFVMAHPGASVVRTGADWSSYRIPADSSPPEIPDRAGRPLAVKSLSTFPSPPHAYRALDRDLRTRWSGGVQEQSADAIVELEQPSHVGQVVIELGGFVTDFPSRLQIDVSSDGVTWEPAWTGATALHAYFGAIRHPREMPLVFSLNKDAVRFIRLRQTGFGKHDWSIPELRVLE